MRILNKVGNIWQEEVSNTTTATEIVYGDNALILTGTYDLTYHAKQLGKGLLVFGAGLLGYVGLTAFFGSRREASTPETERMLDGTLAFPEENLLNVQAEISGMPTALDHRLAKGLMPTLFSTSRTLLGLQEKDQSIPQWLVRAKDSAEVEEETPALASTRRDALKIGKKASVEFRVNINTILHLDYPAVATFPAGGFVVVWQSKGQDGGSWRIFGQRYNIHGQHEGAEFQVNPLTSDQFNPVVEALPIGGFVVVWQSYGQDGVDSVYGQRYDSAGRRVEGKEFQVRYRDSSGFYGIVSSNSTNTTAPSDLGTWIIIAVCMTTSCWMLIPLIACGLALLLAFKLNQWVDDNEYLNCCLPSLRTKIENAENVDQKREIIRAYTLRRRAKGSDLNLNKLNLDDVDLRNINLSKERIKFTHTFSDQYGNTGRNFYTHRTIHVDLKNTSLKRANLKGVNLSNADVKDANFTDAILVNANLHGCNIAQSNILGAVFSDNNTRLPYNYWANHTTVVHEEDADEETTSSEDDVQHPDVDTENADEPASNEENVMAHTDGVKFNEETQSEAEETVQKMAY